jgi:hypothetical protein
MQKLKKYLFMLLISLLLLEVPVFYCLLKFGGGIGMVIAGIIYCLTILIEAVCVWA